MKYFNLPSAMRPVSHSDKLLVPTPPAYKYLFSSSYETLPSEENSAKPVSSETMSMFNHEQMVMSHSGQLGTAELTFTEFVPI